MSCLRECCDSVSGCELACVKSSAVRFVWDRIQDKRQTVARARDLRTDVDGKRRDLLQQSRERKRRGQKEASAEPPTARSSRPRGIRWCRHPFISSLFSCRSGPPSRTLFSPPEIKTTRTMANKGDDAFKDFGTHPFANCKARDLSRSTPAWGACSQSLPVVSSPPSSRRSPFPCPLIIHPYLIGPSYRTRSERGV